MGLLCVYLRDFESGAIELQKKMAVRLMRAYGQMRRGLWQVKYLIEDHDIDAALVQRWLQDSYRLPQLGKWHVLRALAEWATETAQDDNLLVVPTLKGVDRRFVDMLSVAYLRESPIVVSSAAGLNTTLRLNDLRRDATIEVSRDGRNIARARRSDDLDEVRRDLNCFCFGAGDHDAFVSMAESMLIESPAERSERIKKALREAKERGKPIGAQREGSHRFTNEQQGKGGAATAAKRKQAALGYYKPWIPQLKAWKEEGRSSREIAELLNGLEVNSREGKQIRSAHVCKILALAEEAENAGAGA
jgi:hypothetical protein